MAFLFFLSQISWFTILLLLAKGYSLKPGLGSFLDIIHSIPLIYLPCFKRMDRKITGHASLIVELTESPKGLAIEKITLHGRSALGSYEASSFPTEDIHDSFDFLIDIHACSAKPTRDVFTSMNLSLVILFSRMCLKIKHQPSCLCPLTFSKF